MARIDRFFHHWGEVLYVIIATLAAGFLVYESVTYFARSEEAIPRAVVVTWFALMIIGASSVLMSLGRMVALGYLFVKDWYLKRRAKKLLPTI